MRLQKPVPTRRPSCEGLAECITKRSPRTTSFESSHRRLALCKHITGSKTCPNSATRLPKPHPNQIPRRTTLTARPAPTPRHSCKNFIHSPPASPCKNPHPSTRGNKTANSFVQKPKSTDTPKRRRQLGRSSGWVATIKKTTTARPFSRHPQLEPRYRDDAIMHRPSRSIARGVMRKRQSKLVATPKP